MADASDLRFAELHYVFDTLTGVNEPQRVVRQTQRRQRRELLFRGFLVCRFVAEGGQDHARLVVVHAKSLLGKNAVERAKAWMPVPALARGGPTRYDEKCAVRSAAGLRT